VRRGSRRSISATRRSIDSGPATRTCPPPGRVVAVDAKFKHDLCAANIHQMATYCALTGAQHGALVLPGDAALDHEVHLALVSTLKLRVLHLDT